MILRRPLATIDEIDDIDRYHVERAYLASDDLSKRIIRVKTDHGNEFGIRLEDDAPPLERGMVFEVGDRRLLALETIPDKMLQIKPRSMDEMGRIAHYLGNLHKPIEVAQGTITLLFDPVVDRDLVDKGAVVEVVEMELDHPLRHIDLARLAQGDHHSHPHEPRHEPEYGHPHHGHHPHERFSGSHYRPEPEGHLRQDAHRLEDHHQEHEELRELDRDERRALHEDERHRHKERIIAEDAERIGEHPYHHPVHHLEEDVRELQDHHQDHAELRRDEREKWRELEDVEHHRHRAHPRVTYPKDPRDSRE